MRFRLCRKFFLNSHFYLLISINKLDKFSETQANCTQSVLMDFANKNCENCTQDIYEKTFRKRKLMKSRTIISIIALIIILFLARTMYSDHNLKKIINACILAQTQTSSIEEAKQICVNKFKK